MEAIATRPMCNTHGCRHGYCQSCRDLRAHDFFSQIHVGKQEGRACRHIARRYILNRVCEYKFPGGIFGEYVACRGEAHRRRREGTVLREGFNIGVTFSSAKWDYTWKRINKHTLEVFCTLSRGRHRRCTFVTYCKTDKHNATHFRLLFS